MGPEQPRWVAPGKRNPPSDGAKPPVSWLAPLKLSSSMEERMCPDRSEPNNDGNGLVIFLFLTCH
jgi:hypothetical protein